MTARGGSPASFSSPLPPTPIFAPPFSGFPSENDISSELALYLFWGWHCFPDHKFLLICGQQWRNACVVVRLVYTSSLASSTWRQPQSSERGATKTSRSLTASHHCY